MVLNKNKLTYPAEELHDVARYRVEQDVSIKINKIPINNTTVKTDYTVSYNRGNNLFYSVHVDDHIAKMSPDGHQGFLNIVKEIDVIKSNMDLLINSDTGKPKALANHQQIINKWNVFKEDFSKKNELIRAIETQQAIQNMLSVFDEQINSYDSLMAGIENQIFFNTFFDYYLVHSQKFESDLTMRYRSQLFEDVITTLAVSQKIIQETPEIVSISKFGTPKGTVDIESILRQYNEKYRPIIDYQFSEYNIKYNAQIGFNTIMNCIEYAEIHMGECVNNNVEMDIFCHIRRIQ